MKALSLLLLVALTALVEPRRGNQELLVRSKRRWVLSTIEIEEEDTGPFPKEISKMYNDKKPATGVVYHISGMGVDRDPKGVFTINEDTGVVYAQKSVDREKYSLFEIQFDVLNKDTGRSIDRELSFNVEVKDLNDNPPVFVSKLTDNVNENTEEGEALIQLEVKDIDQKNSPNSTFTVSIVSQSPQEPRMELKVIRDGLAHLTLKGCLNYDKAKKIEVIVEARDHGKPSLSSTALVTLNVVDKNSHLPTFREKKYQAEVQESITKDDILRIAVDDQDTPMTPGWRAIYFFMKGNEEGNYKLETDPVTNEGILSVIKGKDFERTSYAYLVVGVKNEEPLFVCKSQSPAGPPPSPDSANITIKVIDVNDPPFYEKDSFDVYQREEEGPGQVLFTPKVLDSDSDVSKIRHVLLEDPAGWVTIDNKTGKITTAKKMDRESPFVNDDGIYKIVIGSIDNGEPPQTGTCTVLIHLGDINDNEPSLANKSVIMCGNHVNKVMVPARDPDANPFSGPFTFSFGSDDKALMERWKLDPSVGYEGGLVGLRALPFDNYSVPLVIQDQQNSVGRHTVQVVVCDCGDGDVCLSRKSSSSSLGAAGIGFLLLGLFLLLLLLLLCKCRCREKNHHMPMVEDEGNQTLIKYNQEGGGSASTSEPTVLPTPRNHTVVTKMGNAQKARPTAQDAYFYNSAAFTVNSNMTLQSMQRRTGTFRSQRRQSMYSTWESNRMNSHQGGSSRYKRSVSLVSSHHISDHIARRMDEINRNHTQQSVNQPHEYAYEGQGSRAESLDELSLVDLGDDLTFLDDLGSRFKNLADVCHQTVKERNIQL
uniref:Cadherin domain-containing protein n=1 Tax=Gasterosteus aculeatus aculeatus TaxID=481459 RepID=G3PQQ2_GASAC|nr:cadherin-like protein 26 isoform X1 [Gasterosteus aculeatus aculeatus]